TTLVLLAGLTLFFRALPLLWTWIGRRRILAGVQRAIGHEWWPTWAYYLPLVPLFIRLAAKYRHPLPFTAANPGVSGGGGLADESKSLILGSFGDPDGFVLPCVAIDEGE